MPENADNPPPTWRPYSRNILACVFLAALLVAGVSLAENRPFTADRCIDGLAMVLLASAAGFFLTPGRAFLAALLVPIEPDEALEPEARSRRRKYRAICWFGVGLLSLGAALLLLFAVSIGAGHGDWASWLRLPDSAR